MTKSGLAEKQGPRWIPDPFFNETTVPWFMAEVPDLGVCANGYERFCYWKDNRWEAIHINTIAESCFPFLCFMPLPRLEAWIGTHKRSCANRVDQIKLTSI